MVRKLLIVIGIILICVGCKKEKIIEITLVENDTLDAELFLAKHIMNYQKSNPGIRINAIKMEKPQLLQALRSKKYDVDVIRYPSEHISDFEQHGYLENLSNVFDTSFLLHYNDEALASATVNEMLLGLPDNYGNHLQVFYNKGLIDEVPGDLKMMIKASKKLYKEDKELTFLVYNLTEPFYIHQWLYGFGALELTQKGDMLLHKNELTNAMQFIYDLKYRYKMVPDACGYEDARSLFVGGKAALFIGGEWETGYFESTLKERLGIASFPELAVTGKSFNAWASTFCFSVIKDRDEEKKAAIINFITFMTSKQVQEEWVSLRRMPSLKSFEDNEIMKRDALFYDTYRVLLESRGKPSNTVVNTLLKSMRPDLAQLLNDRISPYQAADNITNRIEQNK